LNIGRPQYVKKRHSTRKIFPLVAAVSPLVLIFNADQYTSPLWMAAADFGMRSALAQDYVALMDGQ
jgi:hypothetical protein